ncbi:nSTAND1 domain-containing NTPase [Mastigocoleus testarum]|uniref:Uncharacterized protein n=1 Tax=Mastigocoleus testarum BC008 TaxID=371196 RepID=A0A0V7ZY11_9CYAN|nr:CHAT domain-containing protein [Mastigocoleus testarum]KST69469.1 hypothetical protein BC008_35710 [Mastigocoleus testarum BC008]
MVKKILILAANPRGDLELDKEIRDIEEALKVSVYREQFDFKIKLAVRVKDLQNAILKEKPWIVHFCGHGSGSEGLVLENDLGQQQLVSTEALADLFRLVADRGIECVLLNACYSQIQAEAIGKYINYVIGMQQSIRDDAARAFTRGFYDALNLEETIESAYKFGCHRIQAEIGGQPGLFEHLIPVLLKKIIPGKPMARYALVIAVGDYQSQHLTSISQSATDAEAIAQILEKHGKFQVERLPKRQNQQTKSWEVVAEPVTKEQIVQAIKTLLKERAVKNEALIYFTGHGLQILDDWDEQTGFLATSNCELEFRGEKLVKQSNEIQLKDLNNYIEKSDVGRLVMLLDCCHSGSFLNHQLLHETFKKAFSNQKEYYLIAAYPHKHGVKYNPHQQHSIFTDILLKGLSVGNMNNKGEVTCQSLLKYFRSEAREVEVLQMGGGRTIKLVTHEYEIINPTMHLNKHNPYVALKSFDDQKKQYFYGREQAVRALLDRLNQSRFISVIGASGCGKSSLVKAGLLPRIQSEPIFDSYQWEIEQLIPGDHPVQTLINKLTPLHHLNKPFVLFIDQFEEVFTLCKDDKERRAFFRLIQQEATNARSQSKLIVAVRGDFLDRCAEYSEIANLINRTQPTTYLVEPLSAEELKAAIIEPARLHQVKFESGLVEAMVEDVLNQPGALPLLQYTLWQLWHECIERPEIPQSPLSWKHYQQMGKVGGALDSQADLLYQSFVSQTDRAFVQQLFLGLVELGEGETVTRRRVTRDSLVDIADSAERLDEILGKLTQGRLIVVRSEKKEEDDFENYVEVAHEALLTKWKSLQCWIADSREDIRIRSWFREYFLAWRDKYKKSDEALLTGLRLSDVIEWEQRGNFQLSDEEKEFIDKSQKKRDREFQDKLKQEKKLREVAENQAKAEKEKAQEAEARAKVQKQRTRFAITAGVFIFLSFGLGLLTQQLAKQKSVREAIIATEAVEKSKISLVKNNQLEALLESVQALETLKKFGSDEPKLLKKLESVIYSTHERNRLTDHTAETTGVNFHPKGKLVVTAGSDNKIKLWDIKKGQLEKKFPEEEGHQDVIWNVKFSPNGEMIASSSWDKNVKIWTRKGQLLHTLTGDSGHKSSVYGISFSSDSSLLASSSRDGTIKIWDTQTGTLKKTLTNQEFLQQQDYRVYSVDFHPKNNSILASSGYFDGNVNIWYLDGDSNQSYTPVVLPEKHADQVRAVKFSPNGRLLASAGMGGMIKIWDVENRKLFATIDTHSEYTYGIAFSSDSSIIAAANKDGSIKLWKLDEDVNNHGRAFKNPYKTLKGHSGAANRVGLFSTNKDKLIIVSSSDDKTVRIWEIDTSKKNNYKLTDLDSLLEYSCTALNSYGYLKTSSKPKIGKICDTVLPYMINPK